MNGANVVPEDAPDLHEAVGTEPAIVAKVEAPARKRYGPLPPAGRKIIVNEATRQLKQALLALLISTADYAEVRDALAGVGLELRRYTPDFDALAASLRKDL